MYARKDMRRGGGSEMYKMVNEGAMIKNCITAAE
jgi:hypothetical protein